MRNEVRVIVENEKKEVLLGQRAAGKSAKQWSLIGGKVDDGEPMLEAAIREVQEEIGYEFKPEELELYLEIEDETAEPDDLTHVHYYHALVNSSWIDELILEPSEIADVAWVSREDLEEYQIAFDHRERLVEFFKSIQN